MRKLTIQETSLRYGARPGSTLSRPGISLKGKWLTAAGFWPRFMVDVEVEPGKIILTLADDPPVVMQCD